ncbi:cytochrome ubiquinol oxidase subunit I [Xanthovirga aplysinae]|uniref:cytochrome ubiquinol oxidase subunit I n=1 Tax=Xanthovirga aplysinae TaxID=2529853 RepID=UPI0012BD65C0|nr:cytochrome ubiquinol oxidase subunit I [Xanthovirga aplysinae]MTI30935.1 cytochrome ubiquinol oxidase subunit I [Xanthovirga aplysinae]
MGDAILYDRLQFAFTISFHYLFPQLTMGLALLIVILKSIAIRKNDERYHSAARFWIKIFAINFVMGVVTGIPMEFQFGTNWAKFSELTGSIVGQTLAMEGTFSFFLESAFIGIMLFGEKKMSPKVHWLACFFVFVGSWLSGFFIIVTHAWMQHPVGHIIDETGKFTLTSFSALFSNPWLPWEYLHNMIAAVVTSSFVMAGVGAFYLLSKKHQTFGKLFLKVGLIAAFVSSVLVAFPTGDQQAKNVARMQPATLAAMEGLFHTEKGPGIILIGQPNMEQKRIDNPIYIPQLLSLMTYMRFDAEVKGLDAYPQDEIPTNIPLLYYAFHIMVGLGTLFIVISLIGLFLLYRKQLFEKRWMLWLLMALIPFPYIANTAGWMTAELGRQPWLVYKLLRTAEGVSPTVSAGNVLFTFMGFVGLYFLLGVLFLFLVGRVINQGPDPLKK